MTITPIQPIDPSLGRIQAVEQVAEKPQASFSDILGKAIEQVNQSEQTAQTDQLSIAAGEADDLHTLAINSARATLSLQLLVQIRNKALDAYNELMRIPL